MTELYLTYHALCLIMCPPQLHRHGESSSLDHASMLPSFLSSLPPSIASLVTTYHEALCLNYSDVHQSSINTLISAIEDHPIYDALGGHETLLCQFRDGWSGCCARKVRARRQADGLEYSSEQGSGRQEQLTCCRPRVDPTPSAHMTDGWMGLLVGAGAERAAPADHDVRVDGGVGVGPQRPFALPVGQPPAAAAGGGAAQAEVRRHGRPAAVNNSVT